jgi:hypothetical protein
MEIKKNMIGTVIVFNDAVYQTGKRIEFVPCEEGYKLVVYDCDGENLLKKEVFIPTENLRELKNELSHIL